MEINRDGPVAKLQAFSMLGLMAVVAVTVHFWPRQPEVLMTSPAAVAAPAREPIDRQPASREWSRVAAPVQHRAPRAAVAVGPAEPSGGELPRPVELSGPPLAALPSLPGTPLPLGSDLDSPAAKDRDLTPAGGAVTRGMQTTGRSLAGAFKKTGSAFRRAF